MSLVAAYSDSENESEGEEIAITPSIVQNKDNKNGNMLDIEDEDQWQSVQLSSTKTKDSSAATKSSLFSLLPQPKDSPVKLIEEKEDEFMSRKPLSDTVISMPASSSNSIPRNFLNLPKPVKGTKKQPVKISIPTLRKIDDDSDSDEEESKKTVITNMSKSTLFSMLPKPRHSVTVGQNKNRVFQKETNRMLMPHSLAKKKEVNTDKVVDSLNPIKPDEQSDDDEDDVSSDNFFSLDVLSETIDNKNTSKEVSAASSTTKTVTVGNSDNLVGENLTNSQVISSDDKQITSTDENQPTSTDENQTTSANDYQKASNSTSAATKNNAFFANLFKKTEVTSTTSAKNTPVLKQSVINVSVESNNKSNKIQSDIKKTIGSSTSNSVAAPYGSITEPYSNVTEPYGSETVSYNSATEPYKSVTEPYSNVTEPYSSVSTPYGGVSAPYGGVTAPYSSVTEPYGQITETCNNAATQYGSVTAPYGETSSSYASHSNSSESYGSTSAHGYPTSGSLFQYADQNKTEEEDASQPETSSEIDYYNQPNQDLPVEALKALQGSKRRHEEVNIIDVHADQIHGGSDEYLRNLTKEDVYASKKPKGALPRSQEKRKHQITYLAFQAKEREMQLRQSWAESRATKQQTQSRYGF